MPHRYRSALALSVGLLTLLTQLAIATDFTSARVAVYFSPHGGATATVVQEMNAATHQILVQAYSFTSAPIAKALVDAHKRGVTVLAMLDKSNETEKYSAATFLVNAGIQTLIDDQHAIAHNKVMVIDSATIITGSFTFTKKAEASNAENLLVIKDAPELVQAYEASPVKVILSLAVCYTPGLRHRLSGGGHHAGQSVCTFCGKKSHLRHGTWHAGTRPGRRPTRCLVCPHRPEAVHPHRIVFDCL
jgi:hypothetical protein